ncbi:MAG: carboxylating nicotinate-nucleotide diphosphorylase [Ignavibacteria bacterium]|nr:carboxylating nicotinate-nucleotide diphosphorylase [Ignavibacteria bacterium]
MGRVNFYGKFDFVYAEKLIKSALREDIGKGDVTTDLLIPESDYSKAYLKLKENGIVAGLEIFKSVFRIADSRIKIRSLQPEGVFLKKGLNIAVIEGKSGNILKAERVALNIIQRMSGIATAAFFLKQKLANSDIKIVDTRKTTPNFRIFEKLAVKIGGGDNHRYGLYDMILIKDNHIMSNGGIEKTLIKLRNKYKADKELKVEIEVKDINEFLKVLEIGRNLVDVVMLDNFSYGDIRKVIRLNSEVFKIEVSGGVNIGNIAGYGRIKGIDMISVGALTHSVKSLDLALDFIS